MSFAAHSLTGGFDEPVFDAQSVFKIIMDAMARPGLIRSVSPEVAPPAPLSVAQGAVALTLCDADTPVWLSPVFDDSDVGEWLSFHCGAPIEREKTDARFAFAEKGMMLSSLAQFAVGTQEYPDRSTTLVYEVDALEGGVELALTGPGIESVSTISPLGLPESFIRLWNDNRVQFPRGVDVILTAGRQILCLPRTVKITATEL